MKILVTGSRDWDWFAVYKKAMNNVVAELQYKFVVPNKCIEVVRSSNYGVDMMTKRFCEEYGLKESIFTVDWTDMKCENVLPGVTKGGAPYNRRAGVNTFLNMVEYANTFDKSANSFQKSANTLITPILIAFKADEDKLTSNLIERFIKDGNPVLEFIVTYGVQLKLKTHNYMSQYAGLYA